MEFKNLLAKVVERENLTQEEASYAMKKMMSGDVSEAEMAAFLTALRLKGETPEEIAAFAKVMREFAEKIEINDRLLDVCGTGGDEIKTFNISTTSMFIIAASGIKVAKHGNRAISSKCGSADVLEALGININLPKEKVKECIEKVGIGFMFAPLYHRAMANVMPVRKKLGFRTFFNILGPLTNPANAGYQLIGVFDPKLTEKMAKVLKLLKLKRALVAYGYPGLDELSTLGKSKLTELHEDGKIRTYFVKPEDFGIKKAKPKDILAGSSREENAEILKNVLRGEAEKAKIDIVLLNSAAGIYVFGLASSIEEALEIARETLESGKAYEKLLEFINFTRKCSP